MHLISHAVLQILSYPLTRIMNDSIMCRRIYPEGFQQFEVIPVCCYHGNAHSLIAIIDTVCAAYLPKDAVYSFIMFSENNLDCGIHW